MAQVVAFAGSRLRVVGQYGSETIIQDGGAGDLDGRAGWIGIQVTASPVYVQVSQ